MTSPEPRFVWLDLEMTGLDPEACAIIEIGVIITGPDLVPGHARAAQDALRAHGAVGSARQPRRAGPLPRHVLPAPRLSGLALAPAQAPSGPTEALAYRERRTCFCTLPSALRGSWST